MRSVIASGFVLISWGFLMFPVPSAAIAEEVCRCKGCGCKGGWGWRGPDGFCISQAKLAEVCGTPAGAPCKQEAAPRVCFGNKS